LDRRRRGHLHRRLLRALPLERSHVVLGIFERKDRREPRPGALHVQPKEPCHHEVREDADDNHRDRRLEQRADQAENSSYQAHGSYCDLPPPGCPPTRVTLQGTRMRRIVLLACAPSCFTPPRAWSPPTR